MSLAKNISLGEQAVKHVKATVLNGASSNNIKAHVMQSMGGIEAMMKKNIFKVDMKAYNKLDEIAKNNPITIKRGAAEIEKKWIWNSSQVLDYHVPGEPPIKTHYRIVARKAADYRVGNCVEQAAIAYFWLDEEAKTSPIDLVRFTALGYDHVWVLIGRPQNKSLANIAEWGETDTVWCDPWQGRYGMVYSINDLVKRKVVNLDAKFKLDSIENVQAGLPKSILRD